eukprot:840462-Pyramimonas_sp.AAC.1
MDQVEDHVMGQVYTYDRQRDQQTQQCISVPEDLETRPPRVLSDARQAAREMLSFDIDCVQYDYGARHTEPLANVDHGRPM